MRHGSLGGFLHHVSELAGRGQLAFAIYNRYFGAENRATNLGPGQAGNQANLVLLVRQRVAELDNAQQVADVLAGDVDVVLGAIFNYPALNLAPAITALTFPVAYA